MTTLPPHAPRLWTRHIHTQTNNSNGTKDAHLTYTISTNPSHIDLDALAAAFESPMTYWAKPMSREALRVCVDHSLCFGLFVRDGDEERGVEGDGDEAACKAPQTTILGPMIGFARLVTDYSTFAYLTDVYVLESHRGRGLGAWLVRCVDEELATWPDLRRCLLLTRGEAAVRMYGRELHARSSGETDAGLVLMERAGMAAVSYGTERDGRGLTEAKGDH
ncbi:hypothetical protein VTJ49DRAFT_5068 [Mycothermus thermophilus]|uniref:N-acetyltransferase domain-containing protein n=1 Tax=Humicola insolens TaxID=85995 RepID=A0ABR3V3Z5_HUMIN